MLTAKDQSGKTIYIGELIKKEELPKAGKYFCPLCNGRLVVKLGVQRISHFAHVHLTPTCAEYERESDYHMQAKLQLYHWLETQCSRVELEVFLPEIKQRPDLMFTFQEKTYCVEYQCSPISLEIFEKRTTRYLSNEMIPLWILGGNRIQRRQTNLIALSNFHSLFLTRNHSGDWYLPSYCPSLQTFITISNINPFSPQTMQCDYDLIPRSQAQLSQWLNPSFQNTFYVSNWCKGVRQVIDNMIRFQSSKSFLQELYVHRLHPHLLPPYVGVPLRQNLLIETSPIIWQMYVLLDNLLINEVGKVLTYDDVHKGLIKRIKRNHIKVRKHLNPSTNDVMALIKEYFFLLMKCQILIEVKPNLFRYENKVSFPSTIMEARMFEEQFYRNFTNEKIVWY